MAKIIETKIPGVLIIDPEEYRDPRGYFSRIFRDKELKNYRICEINKSFTHEIGTIRGLHMQTPPFSQDKIVQCLQGQIFDVAVDMRPESPTYLQWVGVLLSGNLQLLVPKGFAHGFQTLEEDVTVEYFVSEYYSPECERGFKWDDPKLNIDWPIKQAVTSEKDSKWPLI